MKKIVFLIILVTIGFVSCKSSYTKIGDKNANYIPYYLKVYEADSLYIVQDYKSSYKILDSLFKRYEPIDLDIYYEYRTYCRLKTFLNKRCCKKELSIMISKYGYIDTMLKNDSLLSKYYQKNFTNELYKTLRKEYLSKLNLNLRDEIVNIKSQDQFYRGSNYRNNIVEQNKIDSINQNKLIYIFSNYGFPNKKKIGNFTVDNNRTDIKAVLLHSRDSIRINFFMPKIKKYTNDGSADPVLLGLLQDQLLTYKSKEQYYGTYEDNIDIPMSVLNERRRLVGLPNYGYEKWRFKTLYNK